MKNLKFRTFLLYGSIILALLIMRQLLIYDVEHSPANNVDTSLDSTTGSISESDYYVSLKSREGEGWWLALDPKKPNEMFFGICYDADVYNNSKHSVDNWSVSFPVPEDGTITELWNAEWKIEDGILTVSGLSYNKDIEKGTKETFGFVLYTPQPVDEFTQFSFKATKIRVVTEEITYWIILLAIFTVFVVMITNIIASVRYRRIRARYRMWRSVTEQSMLTIAKTIDAKDEYTSGHSYRVAVISRLLAQKAGLSRSEQENIFYMGLLHDIGKIGIPDNILNKNGRLNDEEWDQVKLHPAIGGDILKDITAIPDIECGARYHHEKWDGTGYGEGKKGEEIPLVARIICVADAYDAMSTKRCYRDEFDSEYIINELTRCAGTQFDPKLVPYMIELIKNSEIKFDGIENLK